jgi:hypothetical protein
MHCAHKECIPPFGGGGGWGWSPPIKIPPLRIYKEERRKKNEVKKEERRRILRYSFQ